MPKVSKETAPMQDHGPVAEWSQDVDGYTISIVRFNVDIDVTPLLKGLPDDRCQCPHWGYVIAGRVTFRFGEDEEVYEAGDAFYTPAGHVPVSHEPGTEIVMFSPAQELRETEAVMMKNMEAMQPA